MSNRLPSWPHHNVGGALALDMVNTVCWRGRAQPEDRLTGIEALLSWSLSAGAVDKAEARELADEAVQHPRLAAQAVARAQALREAGYRVLSAIALQQAAGEADLHALHSAQAEALSAAQWRLQEGRYQPDLRACRSLDKPMLRCALSFCHLLGTADYSRIRRCGDAECGWMFLDTSKGGRRQWCIAELCGNKNRLRRFHAARG